MKRAEIRQRVKRHVKVRGTKSDFEITEAFCMYWWKQLNESVFDGKLTPPKRFVIKAFKRDCGWHTPWSPNRKQRRSVIGINSEIRDRKTFLDVLVHEMVHQWEWEVDLCDQHAPYEHGQAFFAWRPTIERRSALMLCRSYDM